MIDESRAVASRDVIIRNLTRERDRLRTRTVELEKSLGRWRESWKTTINDIGDLMHDVMDRPKGSRFATASEISSLLTKANQDEAGDQ